MEGLHIMPQEGQHQEKAEWRSQARLWSVAMICIGLLSTCFIVGCVVTYQLTYGKTSTKLSQLHTYSSLTCFSEGTRGAEKVWGCCPGPWMSFGSSCYFISTERKFWAKSEKNCIALGAHLVVINTKAEQNFIIQHLNTSFAYFLGLSDPQGNGDWQWSDKTPYKENIRFWHNNEPNSPDERCATIVSWEKRGWAWNDVVCETNEYSICEMNKIYL
ncbi:C-type lectin domain family 6 member A isoform X2 [Erinaceus europaeus]|uniref:C-type lectin domain family 6 member A isoform X2 n=1 Tax=Erinaceus europaeus TaxID=9365 RepID=A0ABM3XBA4_ERIEU|nr:C-type lectin domain family 6 member A isoform X2 [Erinaceus europaeus]